MLVPASRVAWSSARDLIGRPRKSSKKRRHRSYRAIDAFAFLITTSGIRPGLRHPCPGRAGRTDPPGTIHSGDASAQASGTHPRASGTTSQIAHPSAIAALHARRDRAAASASCASLSEVRSPRRALASAIPEALAISAARRTNPSTLRVVLRKSATAPSRARKPTIPPSASSSTFPDPLHQPWLIAPEGNIHRACFVHLNGPPIIVATRCRI